MMHLNMNMGLNMGNITKGRTLSDLFSTYMML